MKILFGVFDWGLGHATRDIPLIDELLKKHEVHIISTGRALELLKNQFKENCIYYDVPSVYVPYNKTRFFVPYFVMSIPRVLRSLRTARKQSEKIIKKGFDKIISDCRFDVYDIPEKSYLINHQLRIKAPYGVENPLEWWLAKMMRKYGKIIVPDFDENSLAGDLDHNLRYIQEEKIEYIGILSHLKKLELRKDINYFISISGPEPQRTVFEKKIMEQINSLNYGKVVIAGGNPSAKIEKHFKNITFYSFLDAKKQEETMNRARFIISRPGYTTMMELAELNKNALLIPTPGQTEQEYLARYYEEKGYFRYVNQNEMNLKEDIGKSKNLNGFSPLWDTRESVKKFMQVIEEN